MPFNLLALLPALIGGGASVAGSVLSSRKGARTSTTSTDIGGTGFRNLRDLLVSQASERLTAPSALPEGFAETGIQDINRTSDLVGGNLTNFLSSRGLLGSPVEASARATLETGRGSDISKLLTSLPLLERQLRDEDFRRALGLFAVAPQESEVVGAGSPTGAGLGSLGSFLGLMVALGKI